MRSAGGNQLLAPDDYRQVSPFPAPATPWAPSRLLIAILGFGYVAYLGLLVTCDVRRVAPFGFVPVFHDGAVTVARLQPDAREALAGLVEGDRLRRANGQILEGPSDWQRVRLHLDPSKPIQLDVDRGGRLLTVSVVLPSGISEWRAGAARPALFAFRLAQAITLGLALVVAFKRQTQIPALIGAGLLASVATVSLALPMRLAVLWNGLPVVVSALLWIPFATSVVVGPLLFAFFTVFPRQVWPTSRLLAVLAPSVLVVGWHVYAWHRMLQELGPPTGVTDWLPVVFAINVMYVAGAVALLLARRGSAETLTDERRIRVLMAGAIVGGAAGAAVVVGHWRNPGADIFASRTLAVLALVVLAVPASFAYAILRHRLFDVSLIVRQGLRYALARGSVDALIPSLAALVVIDVLVNRSVPLSS